MPKEPEDDFNDDVSDEQAPTDDPRDEPDDDFSPTIENRRGLYADIATALRNFDTRLEAVEAVIQKIKDVG